MMMKIAHISTVHNRYDTRVLYKECAGARRAGYDVSLYVADGGGDLSILGVEIRDIGERLQSRPLRFLLTGYKMFRAVLSSQVNICHFHDPELIPYALLLRLTGRKVIYDVHEDVPRQVLSKYWIPEILKPAFSAVVSVFESVAGAMLSGVVAATPQIARRFPASKTVTVQNFPSLGVDTEIGVGAERREPYVVYVGAIGVTRGIREIVEALSLLPDNSPIRLKLAGKFNPASLEDELKAHPGWRRVDYFGWMSRAEVNELLRHASCGLVTLHPTPSYLESYPVKLFEYMAAEVPAIASDFPLWRSIVEESQAGVLVDPMNPMKIADAMIELTSNSELAKKLGKNGAQVVRQKYNWIEEEKKLLELYARMT